MSEHAKPEAAEVLAALDIPLECAPDGQVCFRCYGTHNPQPGVTFVTARHWDDPDTDIDEGP